jgi:hypothetical protein
MGASCATWVATSELYPTEMRATGHSVSSSIAKLGSFLVPYFVVSSISFSTVGIVLGCVNLVASVVAFFTLPETKGILCYYIFIIYVDISLILKYLYI